DQFGWAAFIAGGSMADIPFGSLYFLQVASQMQVLDQPAKGQWVLGKKDVGYIFYSNSGSVNVDMNGWSGSYKATWINPKDGKEIKTETIESGKNIEMKSGSTSPVVLWIYKN